MSLFLDFRGLTKRYGGLTANADVTFDVNQGEILGVIARSPSDAQPVFDTIARSAARLCEAEFCHVFRFDGKLLHFAAHHVIGRSVGRGHLEATPCEDALVVIRWDDRRQQYYVLTSYPEEHR